MRQNGWDRHYASEKSRLTYPDENLVRLLCGFVAGTDPGMMIAVDLGCGSGRHMRLMSDMGVGTVIGLDASLPGLIMAGEAGNPYLAQCVNTSLPLRDASLDLIVAWGSLHYSKRVDFVMMVDEMRRVLKPRGRVFATLRTDRDTQLRRGTHLGDNTWLVDLPDITGSIVTFYSEDEARGAFSSFSSFRLGRAERTTMGSLDSIISHWIIDAAV